MLHALTVSALLAGARGAYRAAVQHGAAAGEAIPVLLAGAGDGADLFLRALAREARPRYRVVGLLTADGAQSGRQMHGVRVEGSVDDVPHALRKLARKGRRPELIVVTAREVAGPRLEHVLDAAEAAGVRVATMPRLTELRPAAREDAAPPLALQPVAIEDLLDRPQRPLDREAMARLVQGGACWSPVRAARSARSSRARSPPSARPSSCSPTTANMRSTRSTSNSPRPRLRCCASR